MTEVERKEEKSEKMGKERKYKEEINCESFVEFSQHGKIARQTLLLKLVVFDHHRKKNNVQLEGFFLQCNLE